MRRGDFARAQPVLERGLDACRTGDFVAILPGFVPALACLHARRQQPGDALLLLEESVALPSFMTTALHLIPNLWVGQAFLLLGRMEAAREIAHRALDTARR